MKRVRLTQKPAPFVLITTEGEIGPWCGLVFCVSTTASRPQDPCHISDESDNGLKRPSHFLKEQLKSCKTNTKESFLIYNDIPESVFMASCEISMAPSSFSIAIKRTAFLL